MNWKDRKKILVTLWALVRQINTINTILWFFFCKGVWRVTTSTWYINISLIKLDITYDLMYLGCILKLPCFIKLLRVWQQISAIWCKTAEITITSLEKPRCWFFLFFLCFGGIKKKKNHKYICLSCAWFYPKLFFFVLAAWAVKALLRIHIYIYLVIVISLVIDIEWLYIVSPESLLSIMDENINLQQNDDNLLHSFFISLFNPEVWFKVLTHIQINYLSSKLKDVLKSIHVYILKGNSLNNMCHSVRVYQATILMSEIEAY